MMNETDLSESELERGISLYWSGFESLKKNPAAGARQRIELPEFARAFKTLLPLAEAGVSEAQECIASMYELGCGVNTNGVEAVRWYERAVAQGSGLAANNLCTLYTAGAVGVPADREKGQYWWKRTGELGFPHRPLCYGGDVEEP
jgi:TPR repeat protein